MLTRLKRFLFNLFDFLSFVLDDDKKIEGMEHKTNGK
jgi:hypothetical protein